MNDINGYGVLNVHGVSWDEDEAEFKIRVSMFDSKDIDDVVINNESLSYTAYEDGQASLPYYIDAPNFIKNVLSFTTECYQYFFRYMLFAVIYPIFFEHISSKKLKMQDIELLTLNLGSEISRISLVKTKIPPPINDAPIEKLYRLHLEGLPGSKICEISAKSN